jgi:polyhydroxyalkanoate synthase
MADATSASTQPARPQTASSGFEQFQQFQEELQRALLQTSRTLAVLTARDRAPVGQTPKDVVWQRGTAQLYHYRPTTARVCPVPLLIVHSLVARPYILDLIPGNSFIEYLVGQGFDVYLIDWGTPRPEDKHLRLEDYVLDLLPACVAVVLQTSQAAAFSLFGYCMGGLLALLYAARHQQAPLRNLITLATPVDFRQLGLQNFWAQPQFLDVDRLVDTLGNVPPELIAQSFRLLRPASEYSPVRYLTLWQNVLNDQYVAQYRAFDQWANEHLPFPGECFRQVTKELGWANKLVQGELELGGQRCRLGDIQCAFLAVDAEQDHIVPLAASTPQLELVGSADKELVVMPGGHVGLAAGRKAVQTLWPKVAAWLSQRSQVTEKASEAQPEVEIVVERANVRADSTRGERDLVLA